MSRSLEELIYHMKGLVHSHNAWEAGFARSILKHSKRASWRPSAKQLAIMQRLVAERFSESELELIEVIE